MRKAIFFPLFLFFFSSKAQYSSYTEYGYKLFSAVTDPNDFLKKEAVVIATSGLKLREKPDTASSVLKIIPFAAKVNIINQDYDKLKFPFKITEIQGGKDSWHWEKVQYGGQVGYVSDQYLWDCILSLSSPYTIISGHSAMPLIGQGLTFYEFKIKSFQSDFFPIKFRKCSPEFRVTQTFEYHKLDFANLYIPDDNYKYGYTVYYLVAKKGAPVIQPETQAVAYIFETFSEKEMAEANQNEMFLFETAVESGFHILYMTDRKTKVKQKIALGCGDPIFIYLMEDLDGDGKPDVFNAEYCKGSALLRLFLSGKAGKGKLFEEMQVGLFLDPC